VTDDRYIILDVWIAIKKLVSPAEDEDSAIQKEKDGNAAGNA
jgi:hypothetical protein